MVKRAKKILSYGVIEMLNGMFIPNFTIFNKDNSVDYAATLSHAEWLAERGVTGLVPFGTFGEGASLSLKEREKLLTALVSKNLGIEIVPTIISHSFGDVSETIALTNSLSIQAVLVIPPSYFHPIPDEDLISYFESVVTLSQHPIIAYNIPWCSIPISPHVARDSGVWGVKDSSGDIHSAQSYLSTDVRLLMGSDVLVVEAVKRGANGGICGLGNIFPSTFARVHTLAAAGSVEEAQQLLDVALIALRQFLNPGNGNFENIAQAKIAAEHIGIIPSGRMRSPLPLLDIPSNSLEKFASLAKALS
jgi:dihydrodipicolinate synthase/N-acetylneuraminate lyase